MHFTDLPDDFDRAPKRDKTTEHDIGRRTRFHARTLAGRVYRPGGATVLLVRGTPDAETLCRSLVASADRKPIPELTPAMLGFASSDIMPIHRGGIAGRARSVQRWRNWIEKRCEGRISATLRQDLNAEWREVESLGVRVAELHDLIAETEPFASPLWLAPADEQALSDSLRSRLAGSHVPAEVADLARLICWITGPSAMRRFLESVRPGLLTIEQHRDRLAVQKFLDVLTDLETRRKANESKSGTPHKHREKVRVAAFRATIREAGAGLRLREHFEALPVGAKSPDRIFLPGRDAEIDLELTLQRTRNVLTELPRPPEVGAFRWLAPFCLTDNETTPIAWEPFASAVKTGSYRIERLWSNRSKPGYRLVLENMSQLGPRCDFESAARFLATGGSVDDFEWLVERSVFIGTHTDHHGAAAQPFRAIVTWLRANDAPMTDSQIRDLWESTATKPGTALLESLARFLNWLPRPSRQQVGEFSTLLNILAHPSQRSTLIDRLRSWANPPARPRLPAGCPDSLRDELAPEVRRLAFYQRLAGQTARIPGSIRGILEARSRQIAEYEHLTQLGELANPAQKMRLSYLSKRIGEFSESDLISPGRLLNQIREVTVVTAMSAVKAIIREEIQSWWHTRFGVEPDFKDFRWQDLFEIVRWADRLPERLRESVNAVMRTHSQFGSAWRRALPRNDVWFEQAGTAIEIESWLSPPPMRFEIDGQSIVLKPAPHPIEVFLMGSRFETCLSLHGGMNAFTVIANAADANKNVIYAYRTDGTPIARKLVGIRSDHHLIGYRLYAHEPSEALEHAFARFCGTWAARSGLGLADSGVPAELAGERWYDDGSVAWTEVAFSAYREIRPEATFETDKSNDGSLVELHRALALIESDKAAAINALRESETVRKSAAAYWTIVAGGFPRLSDGGDLHHHAFSEYRDFLRHVAAAGFVSGIAEPRRLGIAPERWPDYWEEPIWCTMAIVPLDRKSLTTAADAMMRLPAYQEGHYFSSCFESCRISPALAALPFGRIIRLLSKYADFFGNVHCGCMAEGSTTWAQVLRFAWIRQPDSAAFAQAVESAGPVAFRILRNFCEICPDWRFAGPIRRKLRATSEKLSRAELQEIRARLTGTDQAHSDSDSALRPEALAFDPESPFEHRRNALVELAGRWESADAFAGTLLCSAWSHEERALLPIEMRRAFATEMATQGLCEEWRTWPLLHWLATLPEADQCGILMRANEKRSQLITRADGQDWVTVPGHLNESSWPVIIQALEHADIHLRTAAETVFRTSVRRKPELRDELTQLAGPWIWPETYARLGEILRSESPATSLGS